MIAGLRIVLPRARSPRSSFVVGSAVAHLALVTLIVFLPSFGKDRQLPDDFIVVTPVAEVPGDPGVQAAAPPVAQRQAPPEPLPEPEGARVEESVPKIVEKPKKKKPEEKPEPNRTAPPTPAATGPGADVAAGGGPTGVDIASVGLEDLELAWYRDQVIAALKSRWRQPALEGLRESVAVTISFRIARDGSISEARIEGTSGVPSLDRSALRAVIEANPLPPLPPNWSDPVLPARFSFRWYPGD